MKAIRIRSRLAGWRQLVAAAVCLPLALALVGCIKEAPAANALEAKAGEKASSVRIETVETAPLTQTVGLTGTVEAGRIAQLASPAEGPVLDVRVREGDLVKSGQVLLALGRTEAAAALVASLREDVRKEEDNLARTRHLVESGAIAAEQLDAAVANATRMRAQLVKAQETSRDYVLAAPWAGIVSKVKVRDGDFVGPRVPLVEIYDPATLIVRIAVPEQEAGGMDMGGKAKVTFDAYPGACFTGSISRLYPYLDSRTRTRTAEITLPKAPKLLPGMFAHVNLARETIAEAMTVPAHSLVTAAGGQLTVFVAKDGKAVQRKVETGIEVDGQIRIASGLKEGDRVIVAGQERLKDGAPVQVIENRPANPQDSTVTAKSVAAPITSKICG